jgi:hypothetical protein
VQFGPLTGNTGGKSFQAAQADAIPILKYGGALVIRFTLFFIIMIFIIIHMMSFHFYIRRIIICILSFAANPSLPDLLRQLDEDIQLAASLAGNTSVDQMRRAVAKMRDDYARLMENVEVVAIASKEQKVQQRMIGMKAGTGQDSDSDSDSDLDVVD